MKSAKHHLRREAFVATIILVLLVFLVGFFPFKAELVKPIKHQFWDFDIYDLYYSGKGGDRADKDPNVVLVQIGENRKQIAAQLQVLTGMSPGVVGIDATFTAPQSDSIDDELRAALKKLPNAVLAYQLQLTGHESDLKPAPSIFDQTELVKSGGYLNLLGNEFSVVRSFAPFYRSSTDTFPAFSSRIAQRYNSNAYSLLRSRFKKVESIRFSGNLDHYVNLSLSELNDFYANGQLEQVVKNKIVLIGYFKKEPPLVMEDLKFSPLNDRIAGKSFPDIYGVVVHANILSMILQGKYVTVIDGFLSYVVAAFFTFLLILYMLKKYRTNPHPPHWKFILIQLVAIIALLYIFLLLFSWFRIKVELLPTILSLAITVEAFGVYIYLAKLMNRKLNYNTIFKENHS